MVVALVSWKAPGLVEKGSYQFALDQMGLGGLSTVLDLVVLTAVASCLNSALYTASRMAFSLANRGDAPRAWSTTTSRGVPAWAIVMSTLVGFLGVLGNYLLPDKIFGYLLASSGAIALFVYIVIAASQLRMRRQLDAEGRTPPVRMWAYPTLTWVTIVFIVAVLVTMAVRDGQRLELWLSIAVAAVIVAAGVLKHGVRRPALEAEDAGVRPG